MFLPNCESSVNSRDKQVRILIVEDDFVSRKLLLKIMSPIGECDAACNGKEAWEAFGAAHAEGNGYDLILLDIMMPEMDGREVLSRIREYENSGGAKVAKTARIAMATHIGDKETVIKSFRDQCDGYITKPYTRDSMLADLRKYGLLPAVRTGAGD